MKLSKYQIIGIIVAVLLTAVIVFIFTGKPHQLLRKEYSYYFKFMQPGNFAVSDRIEIKGMKVGYVSDIELDSDSLAPNLAKIVIDKRIKIPQNSLVRVNNPGEMAMKYLEIELGNDSLNLEQNDTILFEEPHPNWFGNTLRSLKSEVDILIDIIDSTLVTSKDDSTNMDNYMKSQQPVVSEQLLYFVQIGAFSNKKDVTDFSLPEKFKVKEYRYKSNYNYITGESNQLKKAERLLDELKSFGYKDAFIVAFYNNERITVDEAEKKDGN